MRENQGLFKTCNDTDSNHLVNLYDSKICVIKTASGYVYSKEEIKSRWQYVNSHTIRILTRSFTINSAYTIDLVKIINKHGKT